ncbi:hypothetical protein ACVLV4_002394 [Rathayibacter agropyri]
MTTVPRYLARIYRIEDPVRRKRLLAAIMGLVLIAANATINLSTANASTRTSSVAAPAELKSGDSLVSEDGRSQFTIQSDGNAVLSYTPTNRVLWAAGTSGNKDARFVAQSDGNAVIYSSKNEVIWSSNSRGVAKSLTMQNDGNLILRGSKDEALWATGTTVRDIVDVFTGSVPAGYELSEGDKVTSSNGLFYFTMQADGNPVIYGSDGHVWWTAGLHSPHARFVAQMDGNVVVYSSDNSVIWSTNTHGESKIFSMADDGRVVLAPSQGPVVWESAPASRTEKELVSAKDISTAVSAAIDRTRRASSDERAVVVPAASVDIVREAAVLASMWDAALIVTESDSDPSETNARMAILGTKSIRLYGPSQSFPSTFKNNLGAGTKIEGVITANTAYDRTSQMWSLSSKKEQLVVASKGSGESLSLAATLAMERHAPLLIIGDQPKDDLLYDSLNSSLKDSSHPGLVQIGSALDLSKFSADEVKKKIEIFTVGDRDSAWLRVSTRAASAHSSSLDLWTSPSDQPAQAVAGTLAAARNNGIFIPAGAAGSIGVESAASFYLTLTQSETRSIRMIQNGDTSKPSFDSFAILSTITQRAPAPEFRVTDSTLNGSLVSISVTPRPGAQKYEARGLKEEVLDTSTTPSLTLTAKNLATSAIVALDESGRILDYFSFRMNKYETSSDQDSAVYGLEKDGNHYVRWLSSVRTPRIVTRYTVDPFSTEPAQQGTAIALTCLAEFVDSGLDQTKQYEYKVEPLSLTGGAECGGSGYPSGVTARPAGAVTLPFTQYPTSANSKEEPYAVSSTDDGAKDTSGQKNGTSLGTGGYTIADLSTTGETPSSKMHKAEGAENSGETNGAKTQSLEEGDKIQPMEVYYEQYIPEDKVGMFGYSFEWNRPAIYLHGDGRAWYDLNGSNRVKNQVSVKFGSNHAILPHTPVIGESRAYACDFSGNDCKQIAADTAPSSGASTQIIISDNAFASFHMTVDATIPPSVYTPAPAINGQITVVLQPGGSRAYGTHDLMPRHQVWYGNANADAYLAYQNEDYLPLGLLGIPPASFNVSF